MRTAADRKVFRKRFEDWFIKAQDSKKKHHYKIQAGFGRTISLRYLVLLMGKKFSEAYSAA
jgi:hypothetical protein